MLLLPEKKIIILTNFTSAAKCITDGHDNSYYICSCVHMCVVMVTVIVITCIVYTHSAVLAITLGPSPIVLNKHTCTSHCLS